MAVCVPPEELVGYGTLLQYKNILTDEWTTVGGTKDLPFPNDTTSDIDTTDGSSGGGYRTFIPNPLATLEPVSFEMKFLWSQFAVMQQMKRTQVFTEWRLVLPSEPYPYVAFCGFISSISGNAPMENLVMATITIRPSGAPEWGTVE